MIEICDQAIGTRVWGVWMSVECTRTQRQLYSYATPRDKERDARKHAYPARKSASERTSERERAIERQSPHAHAPAEAEEGAEATRERDREKYVPLINGGLIAVLKFTFVPCVKLRGLAAPPQSLEIGRAHV